MGQGFGGEVATYYARYRRGYPPAAVDAITETFALTSNDLVVDLGCGTGQLSLPLAARVRAVVGMDPEPDMLKLARHHAELRGTANTAWVLGTDRDLPALGTLLGDGAVGAVTVAVAIHWMNRATLFRAARPLLRPGGGVAVVTNGTPLWLQDTEWSRTLRECLQRWLGLAEPPTNSCQTDEAGQRLNRQALESAGYHVVEAQVEYEAELTVDELVGGVFLSAVGRPATSASKPARVRCMAPRRPRTTGSAHRTGPSHASARPGVTARGHGTNERYLRSRLDSDQNQPPAPARHTPAN